MSNTTVNLIVFDYSDGTKDIIACRGIEMKIYSQVDDEKEQAIYGLTDKNSEIVHRIGVKGSIFLYSGGIQ